MAVAPLTSRPLDALYVAFFVVHIPISLIVDFQALYPASLVPDWMRAITEWYLSTHGDPIVAGGMGLITGARPADVVWLKSFSYLELLFQFPSCIIGIWALSSGRRAWYPWLIAYGASTATTVVACVAYIIAYPVATDKVTLGFGTMTIEQKWQVMQPMIPWIVLPALMSIDLSLRIARALAVHDRASDAKKMQ